MKNCAAKENQKDASTPQFKQRMLTITFDLSARVGVLENTSNTSTLLILVSTTQFWVAIRLDQDQKVMYFFFLFSSSFYHFKIKITREKVDNMSSVFFGSIGIKEIFPTKQLTNFVLSQTPQSK